MSTTTDPRTELPAIPPHEDSPVQEPNTNRHQRAPPSSVSMPTLYALAVIAPCMHALL